jgi:hypothetical protein
VLTEGYNFVVSSRLKARIRLSAAWSSNSASDLARRFAVVFTRSICLSSPRLSIFKLKLVVDGILGVVPELERRLGNFEPGDVVRLNFQMRVQIVKEPHLVARIRMLDGLADS